MSSPVTPRLNLFSFTGNIKTLHLSWMAFFITFIVWFNAAPLMASIRDTMGLSDQEVTTLLILNVALTIPARIVIGMLVDQLGPRLVYSLLLVAAAILSWMFALADSFETLAITRFLLGFVGAGFVVGIRLIGEWFPARQVGLAEGIYGGWGNFGSAAAAISLPVIAAAFGGEDGWRYAIAVSGLIALVYAGIFYMGARNTPKGSTYFKPKKAGAMEVTSKADLVLYIAMKAPLLMALALLTWKLSPANLALVSTPISVAIYVGLAALYGYQVYHIWRINRGILDKPVAAMHRYRFSQVAVLNINYLATFGSELAVISMLPLFFMDTFDLSQVTAGLLAASFAFTNLVARPGGGYLSDRMGRKKVLVACLTGMTVGYLILSQISADWALPMAVAATMLCSFFGQAGSGAVFAMVPLIKRRLTGQVAGMVGAYGNIGGVVFLTVLSFVSPMVFFMTLAGTSALAMIVTQLALREPEGTMTEVLPDGTVELIEVG